MKTLNLEKFHPNKGYKYILPKVNIHDEDTDFLDTGIGFDFRVSSILAIIGVDN